MTQPATISTVYATDEDVAIRAYGDYAVLAPASQLLAYGTDGVFSSGTPWVLSSASVNFANQGITSNQVVILTKPTSWFRGSGQLLAVDSVSTNTITLRRLGQALGVGQPPAPNGLTGVEFSIKTLGPQLENASYDINQLFGVDPLIATRTASWIYDQRILRQITVLTALYRQYLSETRTDQGDWAKKIVAVKAELDDARDRAEVRWGPLGNASPPVTVFSRKLSR